MSDGQQERAFESARSAQTVSPIRSLPARISLIVFGATLITSLAVTGISARSIDDFLRSRVEQSFPMLLESARKRLDLWYDQRLLELGVFANSGILAENAPLLSKDRGGRRAERAQREVEQYLSYVLESVPQYEALFVLGPSGERLVWVGREVDLPDKLLREDLAGTTEARLSHAVQVDSRRVQIASAPLSGPGATQSGTLHAVMSLDLVGSVLTEDEMGELGEVFLLDSEKNYLVARPERLSQLSWRAPTLDYTTDSGHPRVLDYYDYKGERVVGAARALDRFGWIVAVEEPYSEAFAPVVSGTRRVLGINLAIVLLFALAAYRVARSIAQPIEALSDIARRISRGEKGIETPDNDRRDEVGILTRTFNEMTWRLENNARELELSQAETQAAVDRMREQNTELQRMNEILEQLSITDGLTQLHNHRYFQEYLSKEVKRASRTGEPLSLVLIDIDHFKTWNDRLGHSGGDEILRRIAEVMQRLTRGTDLLARYGGEEFALLLPSTDVTGAVQLAEKIRSTISESEFFLASAGERQPLTVSIGVSVFAGNKRQFFDEADSALYRAKHAGRDCVMVAGTDPGDAAQVEEEKEEEKDEEDRDE